MAADNLPPGEAHQREDEEWVLKDAARQLYLRNAQASLRERLLWLLSLRRPAPLYPIEAVRLSCDLHARFSLGLQLVPLDEIQGSESEAHDFDRHFRLLRPQGRARWLRAALLRLRGQEPPPVLLIRVDGIYFVRHGHYHLSVARALGQQEIAAQVIEWQVACRRPLPWRAGKIGAPP